MFVEEMIPEFVVPSRHELDQCKVVHIENN